MSNLHLIIEHNIQFLYVCIRKGEEKKVIHARFNDGHAYKILHHQADNGNERIE
jgi:hypothetical protein